MQQALKGSILAVSKSTFASKLSSVRDIKALRTLTPFQTWFFRNVDKMFDKMLTRCYQILAVFMNCFQHMGKFVKSLPKFQQRSTKLIKLNQNKFGWISCRNLVKLARCLAMFVIATIIQKISSLRSLFIWNPTDNFFCEGRKRKRIKIEKANENSRKTFSPTTMERTRKVRKKNRLLE